MNRNRFCLALVALFFAAAILGCADRGPDKDTVLGPDDAPAYKLAALPPDNALLRLSDLTGQALAGRVKVDAYLREFHLVNGVETLVETRVSTATAQADATFALLVLDIPGDGDASGVVDLDDFFLLADTFGLREGNGKFNPVFDMDGSSAVDLTDFFIFSDNFGRRSPRGAGKVAAIVSLVAYEDAPRGRMSEEVFRSAWDALHAGAGKRLQTTQEPEYRFHIQSLELPPAFAAFDIIITGSFPLPGEEPRELLATPAGVVGAITRSLFVTPQDTTVAYGESPAARGILTILYDGVPSLVQAVALVPTSRDTVQNADGTSRVVARFSYEGLSAVQTITVLAPPPPPDTEPPLLSVQFLDGNARLRVTADDNSAPELSVTVTVAGRTVANAVVQEAGASADYNTGLVYDPLASWRTSSVSVLASDGLYQTVLDTTVALVDATPPVVTIADGGSISADGRASLSFTAEEDQSGVSRTGDAVSVVARFPDGTEVSGTYSSLSRYGTSGVSGTVNSVFGSPNMGSPRNVEIVVQVADEAGNTGQSFVTLRQNTYSAPPPLPPPPDPEPEPEPEPDPVPTPVAPSISAATANGIASDGVIVTTIGTAITLSASFSGMPSPSAAWTLASNTASGANTSIIAVSGNLVLTVTNSAGTETRTWQVFALGAP